MSKTHKSRKRRDHFRSQAKRTDRSEREFRAMRDADLRRAKQAISVRRGFMRGG